MHITIEAGLALLYLTLQSQCRPMTASLCEFSRYGEQKIAQFRTHDLTKVLSYVSTQSQAHLQWKLNDLKEMCRIGLIVEYSRMKVPSLSRGCEIAQFFVRYMEFNTESIDASSCYHHVTLKFTHLKRRFWKDEQKMKCGFRRKHFSRA